MNGPRRTAFLLLLGFGLGGGVAAQGGHAGVPAVVPPGAPSTGPDSIAAVDTASGWGSATDHGPVPGETLLYRGSLGVFGEVGRGRMTVSGPECVAGRDAFRLDFEFEGRVLRMRIRDRTTSWLDAYTLSTLRYRKDEKHPLGSRREDVRVDPAERKWVGLDGAGGRLPTATPLDELSFLFFLRALGLDDGERKELHHHFDQARNPIRVEDLGSDTVRVPAGKFAVRVVEMEVQDQERFGGRGHVVLFLTDDELRVPVRIESSMPRVGTLVMSLEERLEEDHATHRAGDGMERTKAASTPGGTAGIDGSRRSICDT